MDYDFYFGEGQKCEFKKHITLNVHGVRDIGILCHLHVCPNFGPRF